MTDDELIKRPLDEEFDTMMEVERNPHGAWEAIQSQADRIEALKARLAKAVEALRWYAESTHDDAGRRAQAVLAEIGGEG